MKNFLLLLRSLGNIAAFGLFGYGLSASIPLAVLGGAAVLLCLYFNLIKSFGR